MTDIRLSDVHAALTLTRFDPSAAMLSMAPMGRPPRRADPPPKEAGVLALLTGDDGDLSIVLTRRTDKLNGHSGQMSFPGGRKEVDDADFQETALREAAEELGIDTGGVTIIGPLTPIYIPPSHFDVYPFVGYLPTLPPLFPNPDEVASVHVAPLTALLEPATRTITKIETMAGARDVPAYLLCGQIVWGATAIMLCEFEHRLRAALQR